MKTGKQMSTQRRNTPKSLLLCLAAIFTSAKAVDQQYASQMFPKVIQANIDQENSFASAIIAHEESNSLFIGGHVPACGLIDQQFIAGAAHVGRVELDLNTWSWSKVFNSEDKGQLLQVSALATDMQGSRVAVYGLQDEDENHDAYLFLLDAKSGEVASQLLILTAGYKKSFKSSAMLLQSDGTVLQALRHPQSMYMASLKPLDGSVLLQKVAAPAGGQSYSASLARGLSEGQIYLGGSYLVPGTVNQWQMAIVEIPIATSDPSIATLMGYSSSKCNEGFIPVLNTTLAPHITHMAVNEGTTGDRQLFGLAWGEQCGHNQIDPCGFVWRVKLNEQGQVLVDSYTSKKIMQLEKGAQFIGMRPKLDRASDSEYWVDAIVSADNGKSQQYIRVSPDTNSNAIRQHFSPRVEAKGSPTSFEAVFLKNGQTGQIGVQSQVTAYQSYLAGHLKEYFVQSGANSLVENFSTISYAAWSTLENEACDEKVYADNDTVYEIKATQLCAHSLVVSLQTENWLLSSVQTTFVSGSLINEQLMPQRICYTKSLVPPTQSFAYTIGQQASRIPLTDFLWSQGTDFCALERQNPVISTTQPSVQSLMSMSPLFDAIELFSEDASQFTRESQNFQVDLFADYSNHLNSNICPANLQASFSVSLTVINPCHTTKLKIDEDHSAFGSSDEVTQELFAPLQVFKWTITYADETISALCGPVTQQLVDLGNPVLDQNLFSFSSRRSALAIMADDTSQVGDYQLLISARFDLYPDNKQADKKILVHIVGEGEKIDDGCVMEYSEKITDPDSVNQVYYVTSGDLKIDLEQFIRTDYDEGCGVIFFQLWLKSGQDKTRILDTFSLTSDNELVVHTDDQTNFDTFVYEGKARLSNEIQPIEQTFSFQIEFKRCPVDVPRDLWLPETQELPVDSLTTFVIAEPILIFQEAGRANQCNYSWSTRVTFSLLDEDSQLQVSEHIQFDELTKQITTFEGEFDSDFVIKADIVASLSDLVTQIQAEILFHFTKPEPDSVQEASVQEASVQEASVQEEEEEEEEEKVTSTFNSDDLTVPSAPRFQKQLQQVYTVEFKEDLEDEPGKPFMIDLGAVVSDQVFQLKKSFKCLTCGQTQSKNETIGFDEQKNQILVPASTANGVKIIEISLFYTENPLIRSTYQFKLNVTTLAEQEATPAPQDAKEFSYNPRKQANEEQLQPSQLERPKFSLKSLDKQGQLIIEFSQPLEIPQNKENVMTDGLALKVVSQEQSIGDQHHLSFSWTIESFSRKSMVIKIQFQKPEYFSQGASRDKLEVTVMNSKYFFSRESLLTIVEQSSEQIIVPKMKPETTAMRIMSEIGDSATETTKVSLVLSVISNLILSGPMDHIWGLVNALQLVTTFPLMNVLMPSNAYTLFQMIVQISELQVIPVEDYIEDLQSSLGIESDRKSLSENFKDFQLDSSGVIRNLQIIFIFMIVLILLPPAMLLTTMLFSWNSMCQRKISQLARGLFFNTYIRFLLESYLQLAIASFVRLLSLKFNSSSDVVNSMLAIILTTIIVGFLVATFIGLRLYHRKNSQQSEKRLLNPRYSELAAGLKTKRGASLLSPSIFMARRLTFAFIVVNWLDVSIALVIFSIMLLNCLQVGYQAYHRPKEDAVANTMDFQNELIVLLCTYCLLTFTDFVTDIETRYTCGWVLTFLVLFCLLFVNLALVLLFSLKTLRTRIRFIVLRKRKIKLLMEARAKKGLVKQYLQSKQQVQCDAEEGEEEQSSSEEQNSFTDADKKEHIVDTLNDAQFQNDLLPIDYERTVQPTLSDIADLQASSSSKKNSHKKSYRQASYKKDQKSSRKENDCVRLPKIALNVLNPQISLHSIKLTNDQGLVGRKASWGHMRNKVAPSSVFTSVRNSLNSSVADGFESSNGRVLREQSYFKPSDASFEQADSNKHSQYSVKINLALNSPTSEGSCTGRSNQPMMILPVNMPSLERPESRNKHKRKDSHVRFI